MSLQRRTGGSAPLSFALERSTLHYRPSETMFGYVLDIKFSTRLSRDAM
jgi:hypothetical protein